MIESKLSQFVTDNQFESIPPEAIRTAKNVVLTVLGTTVAGSHLDGIKPLVDKIRDWGGKGEATILMHGGKIPAHHAAFVNAVMARALDFDDAFTSGPHFGAAAVPAALASVEYTGGCSGKEFLTALILGMEVSARLNLTDEQYNGFDPTGVCSVFAASTAAGRLFGLNSGQMHHCLALAFNRCSGSFQSHIDGSLAVRLNQGFVSQNGVLCAQLAQIGMTGPKDFLTGIYGYFHLYGKDKNPGEALLDDLGQKYKMIETVFKKYPNCGATQASTDAILALIQERQLTPEEVTNIEIYVTPATYKLAGKTFEIGDNPRVDAQFSIQYCVANVLLRKSSRLEHFDEPAVKDPQILDITRKIRVFEDKTLRGHTAMRMTVKTRGGQSYTRSVDIASGFPGRPLTREDHLERFRICIEYARDYYPVENRDRLISLVDRMEDLEDIRLMLPLLKNR